MTIYLYINTYTYKHIYIYIHIYVQNNKWLHFVRYNVYICTVLHVSVWIHIILQLRLWYLCMTQFYLWSYTVSVIMWFLWVHVHVLLLSKALKCQIQKYKIFFFVFFSLSSYLLLHLSFSQFKNVSCRLAVISVVFFFSHIKLLCLLLACLTSITSDWVNIHRDNN